MTFTRPHWLTLVAGLVGASFAGIAQAYPPYASICALVSGVCALLATPTIGAGK
jgi:hypothetical protein